MGHPLDVCEVRIRSETPISLFDVESRVDGVLP